ncbi:MAG: asparagine synthase (glutamine-hydrolyzing) [Candidatus Schekmanbacteria bacterium]|nr:MAG: asparagine synthase (glutamine-hydrolyzing) [Candidatus Schekmanbacteria bacterium]
MCGISGFQLFDNSAKASIETISAMTKTLRHRGPDDEQHFITENFALGSNRLAIIDPAGGKQPAFNEQKNIAAILNGEIYNCREIGRWLTSKGHILKSNSDTEILPHLYEELGEKFVEKIEGMFALALLDIERKRIILVRDRLGIKPLYYYLDNELLAFASEIKALLTIPSINKELNVKALIDYFTFGYILTPQSPYKSILSLPPASLLIAENGKATTKRYWNIPVDEKGKYINKNFKEEFIEKLESVVESHLLSDVPLGVFLSGGLDSSIISVLMKRASKGTVNSFTANLWYQNKEDIKSAEEMAYFLESNHITVNIGSSDVEKIVSIISLLDEPFADSSFIPTFLISEKASKNLKVVLSGDGSDENFAGYPSYVADKYRDFIYGSPLKSGLLSINNLFLSLAKKFKKDSRIERLQKGLKLDELYAHLYWRIVFDKEEIKQLFVSDFLENQEDYSPFSKVEEHYEKFKKRGRLNSMLFLDISTWLVDDILKKVDLASMANSLEVRVPFIDHRIVEYAASLPENLKLNGITGKFIIKESAKELLPEKILKRRKKGFHLPLAHLLRNELEGLTLSLTGSEKKIKHRELNWNYINGLVKKHLQKNNDYAQKLWTIICYIVWKEKNEQ